MAFSACTGNFQAQILVVAFAWEDAKGTFGERQRIERKGVCAIEAEKLQLEMAKSAAKSSVRFSTAGCQQFSVNTLLCDTLGLAQ